MVNTNLLLALGFSAITNFANLVPIPKEDIPTSATNLHHYRVGSPRAPVDLGVTGPHGTMYQLIDGVVQSFRSSQNFFGEEDTNVIAARYTGKSALTSNEVVLLASNVLQRLVQPPYRLTNGPPKVQQAGFYQGKQVEQIPFFVVEWPKISPRGLSLSARVEIDGRTGTFVGVQLLDMAFWDMAAVRKFIGQVYTPDAVSKGPRPGSAGAPNPRPPRPTPKEIERAVTNWLAFCGKVGIDPGGRTAMQDIDWDETWAVPDDVHSATVPVCNVRFMNGAGLIAFEGTVFGASSPDCCYDGTESRRPASDWDRFRGKILKKPEQLTQKLERALIEKVGLPAEELGQFSHDPFFKPPEVGTTDLKRMIAIWRTWPVKPGRAVSVDETRLGFIAEFDLETGEVKSIMFYDPGLWRALARAQAKKE